MASGQDSLLTKIVQKLTDEFHPKKIYLFGSRATGSHGPHSDYDLFLIVDRSDKSSIQRMQRAHRVLWDLHAPVDVLVYTQEEYDQLKDDFGSIANAVATEGVELSVG